MTIVAPTFAGAFDTRSSSDYMLGNGNSEFSENALKNWDRSWHKVGALFTIVAIVFNPSPAAAYVILANQVTASQPGYAFGTSDGSNIFIKRTDGAGNTDTSTSSVGGMTAGGWNFVSVSVNESGGATASHFRIGTNVTAFDGTMSFPTSALAGYQATIMGRPTGTDLAANGFRIMTLQAWNRALSQAETYKLYSHWRRERMFGLI
jgi:hypothetical protein